MAPKWHRLRHEANFLVKTHINKIKRRSKTEFVLTIQNQGKRQRKFFPTRAEAEREEKRLRVDVHAGESIWNALGARERSEVIAALKAAHDRGLSVQECLDSGMAARVASTAKPSPSLAEMITDTISTLRTGKRKERYLGELEKTWNRFARGRTSAPISSITKDDIETWLATQKGDDGAAAVSTIKNLITRVSKLFAEAQRCEYITINPVDNVLRPMDCGKTPRFLKAQQASDLLWVCRATDKMFLPYLVIGMFAGVRPEEMEKLKWSDIQIPRSGLHISEEVGKMGHPRNFQVDPIVVQWLGECQVAGEYIVPHQGERRDEKSVRQWIKRHRKALATRSGVELSQDILRKTAASYLMEKHGYNQHIVAKILGNSPKMLEQFYIGLVLSEDAAAFWKLSPANVPNTPIQLPKGGKGYKRPGQLIRQPSNVIDLAERAA